MRRFGKLTWACSFLLWINIGCIGWDDRSRAGDTAVVRPAAVPIVLRDQRAATDSGDVTFDVYLPAHSQPAPLVVVAHGFSRDRSNMAGWGERLACEGLVAAVPTLPKWSDHRANGRAINELIVYLSRAPYADRIDRDRLAIMGFSAGGLATLLAAADNPRISLWIGLDPVDVNGWGADAAGRLRARVVMIRAEPSPWNAYGNAAGIEQALAAAAPGRCTSLTIPGAVHIDAEWPTTPAAQLVCGQSDDQKREAFVSHALALQRNPRTTNTSRGRYDLL